MKEFTTILTAIVLFLSISNINAQSTIEKQKLNVNKEIEDQVGYTQAVKVGHTIYISGIAARGPMNEAINKIYTRAEKILTNYNATLHNVVKENAYTTQIDELIKNQELRKQFYKNDYPSSTWTEIKRLYVPDTILEIEFVAEVKD